MAKTCGSDFLELFTNLSRDTWNQCIVNIGGNFYIFLFSKPFNLLKLPLDITFIFYRNLYLLKGL